MTEGRRSDAEHVLNEGLGQGSIRLIGSGGMGLDPEAKALAGLLDHELEDIPFGMDIPDITHLREELVHFFLFGWADLDHLESLPKGRDDFSQPVLHDGGDQESVEIFDELQHRLLGKLLVQVMEFVHKECGIVVESMIVENFDQFAPTQTGAVVLEATVGFTVAVVILSEAPAPVAVVAGVSGCWVSLLAAQGLEQQTGDGGLSIAVDADQQERRWETTFEQCPLKSPEPSLIDAPDNFRESGRSPLPDFLRIHEGSFRVDGQPERFFAQWVA